MEDLKSSLTQYNDQLTLVNDALKEVKSNGERESLLALQSELQQLVQLTQESVETLGTKEDLQKSQNLQKDDKNEFDDEYALFMQEMAETGAYATEADPSSSKEHERNSVQSEVEDELAALLGMKCGVYHIHKWGGQPTLHNAMVSAVLPRKNEDQFNDLQVRVLFTHPTHAEMLPCPFFLEGDCKFDDEKCRYSHGAVVHLSTLKDAIEPNFEGIKVGSRILMKLKPPDGEDISLAKKSTEKYLLWHSAIVKSIDIEKKTCLVKLEHGVKTGEKRKCSSDEYLVHFEEIFPLNSENDEFESEDSLSDTEYPESKAACSDSDANGLNKSLLIEKSFQNSGPAMGQWEQHTRGIGSKLMLAMGYVPGTGLGAAGEGRVQPVEARVLPVGKSLDHCMAISENNAAQDPLKVEQRLKRLQKKEEDRNKKAYEREKEKERRNVFNFLNKTLGNKQEDIELQTPTMDLKQSTSKNLNIEHFKIMEEIKKLEREIPKLSSSLTRYAPGSNGHTSVSMQLSEKSKVLDTLRNKERQITREQNNRKDKKKMTLF